MPQEPSLSRAEYWILNQVAEFACPVCFLDTPDPELLFNKAGHGLSRPRLIEVLLKLSTKDWIVGCRRAVSDDWHRMDREEIAKAVDERGPKHDPQCLCYRLSIEGAETWEAFAAPDWDRYLNVLLGSSLEWTGANERRIRKYFALASNPDVMGINVRPASIEWDELRPWSATYWKVLPVGFRVRCEYQTIEKEALWDVRSQLQGLSRWCDWT